ncbi:MAG: TldD/PmbA family protein [Elusimicrobia bacterium]|nr:TldD/PmbA family protein [Elusimicrobiota bacterium]
MTAEAAFLSLADAALDEVRREAPGLQAELYLVRGRDRGLERKEGRPEFAGESSEEGMGLRLGDGSRMASTSAGGLAPGLAGDLARRAKAQLPLLTPDPARVLPPWTPADPALAASLAPTLEDPAAFARPLEDWGPALDEMTARALRADKRVKKVLHAGFGESSSEVAIVSTAGARAYERGASASIGLSLGASSGAELQLGSGSRGGRRLGELDWDRVADDAVFRAVSLLGAKRLPSKKRSVLFDPWVAGDVLDLLAGPLSAEAVQKGRSLFKGRLGKRVASRCVTLVDDPHFPGGLGSSLFDDEAVPTRRKVMVERGVLRELYYDACSAAREGRASNASASRGGYRGLPGPGPTSLTLAPGALSRERLLGDTKDGILVFEIMGMHTADPVSGEFSVGVSGVAVRGGELAHGIKGAMLSGNVLELFGAVDAVADDLISYGSLSAPTFRAAGLTVA